MKKHSVSKSSSAADVAAIIREAGFCGTSRDLAEAIRYARVSSTVTYPLMIFAELGCNEEINKLGKILNSSRAGAVYSDDCRSYASEEVRLHADLFGKGGEPGYFVQKARGGTLLLQNIHELSRVGQLYLRGFSDLVRQENLDVRIITTVCPSVLTKSRGEVVDPGLFDRLHSLVMHLPPLRNRREDIPPLIEQYLREFARGHRGSVPEFSADIIEILKSWPWECNHMELESAIYCLCANAKTGKVTLEDLKKLESSHTTARLQPTIAI